MKKIIYKYIFYEFTRYFTTTLFALSLIVWTVQAVNFLDLVTEDGHALTIYFLYSLLSLSKVFTKLIPFSFLIATVELVMAFEEEFGSEISDSEAEKILTVGDAIRFIDGKST